MRPFPAPAPGAQVIEQCPVCLSGRIEYEFTLERRHIARCVDCTMLFQREPSSRPPDLVTLAARARAAVAAFRQRHGALTDRILVVLPAAIGDDIAGCDVMASEQLIGASTTIGAYAAAVCVDVLDRAFDPSTLLDSLKGRLRDEATVAFVHASLDGPNAPRRGTAWPGFRSDAVRYFGVDTLQSLLVRHGFRDAVTLRGEDLTVISRVAKPIDRYRLSVIVPVFNERSTFRLMMDQLVAKEIDGVDIEIIVIESNSTDGSRDEVQSYATHPRVRVLLQDTPRGKGNAVRAGLAVATGDIVLFQDADLEYEVEDYDDLIRPIMSGHANFVIGSRHGHERSVWKIREFNGAPVLSQVFNLGHVVFLSLLNGMYGQRMADPFSMFKVFRRDCLAGLHFECDRFDFDFEIVIKLLRKGYKPREIPVNYHARSITEGKKVTMIRDPLTWIRALLRFRSSPLYDDVRPVHTS